MSALQWLQLLIYAVLDIVPCALLAAAAFRGQLRSARAVAAGIAALYLLNLLRRYLSLSGVPSILLSSIWIAFYLIAYRFVVRAAFTKLLFVLISILNYASLTAILYSFIGDFWAAGPIRAFPFCFEASATLLFVFLFTLPPFYYFLSKRICPLMQTDGNETLWRYLWLVPATFCLFFYYSLYQGGGVQAFSSHWRNLLYSTAVSAGGFFVLFLTVRMVEETSRALRLSEENYQLILQSIGYENLQKRMDETRRAQHDLRQCMTVLEGYLQNNDTEKLKRFAARYLQTLPDDTAMVYTRHSALNALIFYYAGLSKTRSIRFEAQVDYPEDGPLSDVDLAVLFGNLLENAVEACVYKAQPPQPPFIALTVRRRQNALIILVENSCFAPPVPENEGFRSVKRQGGGVGVVSVKHVAEKYGGFASFSYKDNIFSVSIFLNP